MYSASDRHSNALARYSLAAALIRDLRSFPVRICKRSPGVCFTDRDDAIGHVAELVGIEGGVVSGVINLESSGV